MNSAELRELAEACEKATGADDKATRLLGRKVLLACGKGYVSPLYAWMNPAISLDAAMSLVPEDTRWTLGNMRSPRTVAVVNSFDQGSGANPALALCAAALRAKAQEADRG